VKYAVGELWDNPQLLELDPNDPQELSFALLKSVRKSGLSLSEISARLKNDYGVALSPSGISHAINRGTIRFQRALQILAVCGVSELQVNSEN
jgi:hypothetical protein